MITYHVLNYISTHALLSDEGRFTLVFLSICFGCFGTGVCGALLTDPPETLTKNEVRVLAMVAFAAGWGFAVVVPIVIDLVLTVFIVSLPVIFVKLVGLVSRTVTSAVERKYLECAEDEKRL